MERTEPVEFICSWKESTLYADSDGYTKAHFPYVEGEQFVLSPVLERFAGKKTRVTIEVIEKET